MKSITRLVAVGLAAAALVLSAGSADAKHVDWCIGTQAVDGTCSKPGLR